ncbi:unnamed protein product, partial [Polarella glacialis]
ALPDKDSFLDQWLAALAAPSVCITEVADVKRLDMEDISSLPVPPIVKGVFREVLAFEADKLREENDVLHATLERSRTFLAPLRDRNMQPPLALSKYFQDQKNYKLILQKEEIEAGVRIAARRIETWCKGERIVLVAILKGAFMFLSDLCRNLVRPYSVYFVEASSYKDKRAQTGSVDITGDLASSKFCDAISKVPHKVVLIDELLDNGKTMQEMKQHFLSKLSATHSENDILTVCLLSKKREREWPEADITAIRDLPDLWLVGYGLDDRGTKRGWTELFAIPKVKIVETLEIDEVQKLLENLDADAHVISPIVFAGFELTFNSKMKYRVHGLDILEGRSTLLNMQKGAKTMQKADIIRILAGVSKVKAKYEHELQFSFIQENVALVPEDSIFSGDNQVFAEMRCGLRRQIQASALRFGVQGLEMSKV